MKTVLALALLLFTGCTSLKIVTERGPDGVITIRELTRWSFMAGAAFETVEIPGLGTLKGYRNDGGKGSLAEVGVMAGQITEGAVRGAVKSQTGK